MGTPAKTEISSRWARITSLLLALCLLSVVVSAIAALISARHWPLFGDSALIRYVVFLQQHGHAPYTQIPYTEIKDINLPGSYLLEFVAMKLFGAGALGLRLYDTALCLAGCALMIVLSEPNLRARLFGLAAGLLFLLIHLQDGLGQAGQRDFAMAILALAACAILLRFTATAATLFTFELLIGLTAIIKPTLLPLALLPFFLRRRRHLVPAIAGLILPALATYLWLLHWHATQGFVQVFTSIAVLHGELGRRTLGFLLAHCTSPILALFILWIILLILTRPPLDEERKALFFAAACGLFSYLAQGKAYPYQRYPFLAFCLLLIARDVARALELRTPERPVARCLALISVCVACLWFAPHFARVITTFTGTDVFEQQLSRDLNHYTPQSIQCLDTFGGCINTLYDQKLVQSTGFLYDCYLFAAPSSRRDAYRADFLAAFEQARPGAVVLTDQFCFNGTQSFDRLTTWPALNARLQSDYTLATEWHSPHMQRWSSRWEQPAAYRLYLHR